MRHDGIGWFGRLRRIYECRLGCLKGERLAFAGSNRRAMLTAMLMSFPAIAHICRVLDLRGTPPR